MNLSELPPDVILARLADLLGREQQTQLEFLLHLAEVDRRRIFAKTGHGSLWDFCEKKLGLHKSATYQRVTAVDMLNRYPIAIAYLRDGRVSMSALVLLRNVLTTENAPEWLDRISQKPCIEIEAMTGDGQARTNRKDGIRKLPPAKESTSDVAEEAAQVSARDLFGATATNVGRSGAEHAAPSVPAGVAQMPITSIVETSVASASAPAAIPGSMPPAASKPPASHVEEQYRLTLTVGPRFKKLLDEASALASHKIPRRDPGAVVLLALESLVEKLKKQRGIGRVPRAKRVATSVNARATPDAGANAESPRCERASLAEAPPVEADSPNPDLRPFEPDAERGRARQSVPVDVYRGVWERDEGRCVWKMPDGQVCGSTWQLELDHDPSLAQGGTSTIDGCRLLCRVHNQQAARDVFGDEFMDQFRRRSSR